ncbi:MAG: DMT family transporter [Actinobacteria bacterium]|nr:DMT family transporter [Actinomycetota bacterium]
MLTILTGLFSALSYATSDMFSQRVTRETRALTQIVWVLGIGAVIVVPVALVLRGLPDDGEWAGAGLAALAGVLYFGALYFLLRGLDVGDLGLVSALVSLQGACLAVTVILLGEPVTPVLALALVLCVAGAVLTSFEGRAGSTRGAPWAFAAGLLFTGVMLCYNYGDIDWLSQAAISRSVSLLVALPVALLTGSVAVPRALRPKAAGAGILELAGLALLTITFALGPATVAGVTTTQFGTFAVVLGFVLLHERPKPNQWAGILCTLLGVSLLAAVV